MHRASYPGATTETGRIRDIHIKSDYGFVLFEDDRDADDAVYYLHGYELDGKRLIVEHQRGKGALGFVLVYYRCFVIICIWFCHSFVVSLRHKSCISSRQI
jgi:hypothetical protein